MVVECVEVGLPVCVSLNSWEAVVNVWEVAVLKLLTLIPGFNHCEAKAWLHGDGAGRIWVHLTL